MHIHFLLLFFNKILQFVVYNELGSFDLEAPSPRALITLTPTLPETVSQRGKMPSFPRKRESRSLKLLLSSTAWMPASAGMTNYDTVFPVEGEAKKELLETDKISSFSSILSLSSPQTMGHKMYFTGN